MEGVQIFEQDLKDDDNKVVGKVAILVGGVDKPNPKEFMDNAVHEYVGGDGHNQYVEIHLDNPWTRVITSGINNLPMKKFTTEHRLKS